MDLALLLLPVRKYSAMVACRLCELALITVWLIVICCDRSTCKSLNNIFAAVILFVFVAVYADAAESAQILKGPSDAIVSVGGSVVFNCSVTCSAQGAIPVAWYMTLPVLKRNVAVSPYTSLSQMKSFYGLDLKRSVVNSCGNNGSYTAQLSIQNVTSDLNMMPVQCGALLVQSDCGCPDPQLYFSKLSILTVKR